MQYSHDKVTVVVSVCVALTPLWGALVQSPAALAQTESDPEASRPTESSEADTVSDWLRVTAERVNIRSRADLNSRIVARANRGDVLESRGDADGWRKILPPTGAFSIAAAQYIDRIDADRGCVNVDTLLRVRIGSDIQPRDPMLSEVCAKLERDAEVVILGELDAEWLKIAPPAGVYVYISSEFVEVITAEQAQRLRLEKAAAATEAAKALETLTTQPSTRPASPEPPTTQAAESTPPASAAETATKRFDARGVLKPSFALPAGPYGMRYMLKNPRSRRVSAYLEIPTELGVDTKSCAGKYVGVRGKLFTLDEPRVSILRVTELVILDMAEAARETP